MCNCIHELLNVFEDSAQRERTINTNDIKQTLKVHGTHLKLFYPPKKVRACMCGTQVCVYVSYNCIGNWLYLNIS